MKKLKDGWMEGSVKDFLDLAEAGVEHIELRHTLSRLPTIPGQESRQRKCSRLAGRRLPR